MEKIYERKSRSRDSIFSDKLNEYRKIGKFTDLVLKSCDNKTMTAHKNILSVCCPYFEAALNSNLIEQDIIEFKETITIDDLEFIIDFIYTGIAKIPSDKALHIYTLADYFLLQKLKFYCEEILATLIETENCLEYWRCSVTYSSPYLNKLSRIYIGLNTKRFLEKEILKLTLDEIKIIVSTKDLQINEEDLFKYIIQWISDDYQTRESLLNDIVSKFNFSNLSDEFIKSRLIPEEISLNNEDFLPKLAKTALEKLKKDNTESSTSDSNLNKNDSKKIKLITNNEIYTLNWNDKEWIKNFTYPDDKYNYNDFAMTTYKNDIFMSGGHNEKLNQIHPSFKYWNSTNNEITKLSDMAQSRYCHQLIECEGKIYSCGGRTNFGTVEIYDFGKASWSNGPTMKEYRYNFGITHSHNAIYAFGGYRLEFGKGLFSKNVEQLDPRVGKWQIISKSLYEDTKIISNMTVTTNDYVYCFNVHNCSMIFDLRANQWCKGNLPNPLPDQKGLKNIVPCNSVVEYNDEIFGVFLTNNSQTWETYKFDPTLNKWNNSKIFFKGHSKSDIRLCVIEE